jgi:hypothetical protein
MSVQEKRKRSMRTACRETGRQIFKIKEHGIEN